MVSHTYKMTGTYCRPLSQRLADWQTQVVIHAAFDQGDDVDSFENIVDKAWKGSANVLATDGGFPYLRSSRWARSIYSVRPRCG
jgi:hypothetical protein